MVPRRADARAFRFHYSPELNPAEHLWDSIREECFANQVHSDGGFPGFPCAAGFRMSSVAACAAVWRRVRTGLVRPRRTSDPRAWSSSSIGRGRGCGPESGWTIRALSGVTRAQGAEAQWLRRAGPPVPASWWAG